MGTNLRVESPSITYVPLQSFRTEFRMQCIISKTMDINNMLRYVEIDLLVTFIQDDEKEVETTHDRSSHRNVPSKRLLAIVPATDGVCGGKNGRARIECGVNTRLGNGYGLLFHGFVNGNLVRDIHFVKFVDGANPVIRKHQCASLDSEVPCLFVFHNRCRKTCC